MTTWWLNDNQREQIRKIATAAFKQNAGLPDVLDEIDQEVITALRADAERRLKNRQEVKRHPARDDPRS